MHSSIPQHDSMRLTTGLGDSQSRFLTASKALDLGCDILTEGSIYAGLCVGLCGTDLNMCVMCGCVKGTTLGVWH